MTNFLNISSYSKTATKFQSLAVCILHLAASVLNSYIHLGLIGKNILTVILCNSVEAIRNGYSKFKIK